MIGDDDDEWDDLRRALEAGLFGEEPNSEEFDLSQIQYKPKKCECGAEKVKVNRHSDWCEKYEEN